jgi:hypothetical protein
MLVKAQIENQRDKGGKLGESDSCQAAIKSKSSRLRPRENQEKGLGSRLILEH